MEQDQIKSVLIGVFPSTAKANRAISSLREFGIGEQQILLHNRERNDAQGIRELPEFRDFSDDELRRYEIELEKGHVIVTVVAYQEPDEVVSILVESGAVQADTGAFSSFGAGGQTLPLYEEQLQVTKESNPVGEVVVRKVIEEVPTQAEVEALHEELDVEHVSVGEVVQQRREPWREGNTLVVPVYEEQLVVVRQLVMREQLRISLHQVTEKHLLVDTLKREHAIVEDPDQTGRVRINRRPVDGSEQIVPDSSDPPGQ